MEIRQQYLQRYLHDIAIDQLMDDYEAKGYLVTRAEKVGEYQADLVARKGDEVVVVEVKAGKMTPKKREELTAIGDYVRTKENYKFLVVVAIPPKRKKITVPNIESLLLDYFKEHIPNDLQKLYAQINITSVTSVNLNEVTVNETGDIVVNGNALIEVELRYANSLIEPFDFDGIASVEVFPCSFDAVLTYTSDKQLAVEQMKSVSVDTSD
ncbi:hypothetical protein ACFSUS_07170 [Spirosoma soli]|uniref:REase AHJR-like domain-containing protein n=1 Tax=Spirosoma soli TaxID=1770529 RepID=A0ABW5M1E8_9BACT